MSRRWITLAGAVVAASLAAGLPGARASGSLDARPAVQRLSAAQVRTTTVSAAAIPEQAEGIGPGSHLLITFASEPDAIYGCTANYVWRAGKKLYLGAAGHCFIPEGKVATRGPGADYDPRGTSVEVCVSGCTNGGATGFVITGTTVRLGPVRYARRAAGPGDDAEQIGHDFGVVEIPAALHRRVRLTMPVFGGPTSTGSLETGETVCQYGNGVAVGEVWPTMGRFGPGLFEDAGAWFAATPTTLGDSGAAAQTCVPGSSGLAGREAIGLVTHITNVGTAGTTEERAVEMARRDARLDLTLLLPGSTVAARKGTAA